MQCLFILVCVLWYKLEIFWFHGPFSIRKLLTPTFTIIVEDKCQLLCPQAGGHDVTETIDDDYSRKFSDLVTREYGMDSFESCILLLQLNLETVNLLIFMATFTIFAYPLQLNWINTSYLTDQVICELQSISM